MIENNLPSNFVLLERFVNIGTHHLHVVLIDTNSEYTVVLESGGGKDATAYQEVQEPLARCTGCRVMSYDRSGFGQSELGPESFDAIAEVDALKRCLEVQGFKNKLILAGHSYGGLLIQLFTLCYPEQVSGLALIDPMNVRFVDVFGLDKLNAVTPYSENPTKNPEKAGKRMVDFFPRALEMLRGKDLPSHIPTVLITAGYPLFGDHRWRECHEQMVMQSKEYRLLVAEGNTHDILEENPGVILNALIELVSQIRSCK